MKTIVSLLALLPFCALTVYGGDAKKDLAQLQGKWGVELLEEEGKNAPEKALVNLEVIFAGDKASVADRGKVVSEFTVKLDDAKDPKQIDFFHLLPEEKGKVELGIYAFDGEKVKLCVNDDGKTRPSQFATTEKSSASYFVLKKKK